MELIAGHLRGIGDTPAVPQLTPEQLLETIPGDLPREELGVAQVLAETREKILPGLTRIGHPRFWPWILSSPSPAGTLGELINVGLNQTPGLFRASPVTTVLERVVTGWFAGLFGLPVEEHGGVLVSGGTMANLHALATAREWALPGSLEQGVQGLAQPLTLYASSEAHASVERSAGLLGLGARFVRKIPVDRNFRLRMDELARAVAEDRQAGLRPFCVVAQAGAVTTGAVDPLPKLAEFCHQESLWLHVDAAYGGGAILTAEGREKLRGIERADSIATDPHKWFFIPVEAGLTLVRDRRTLFDTFHLHASYLGRETEWDMMNYTIQLTRASRAFKIWFAFRAYGLDKLGRMVARNLELARQLAHRVEEEPRLELCAPVGLSIVCFRYLPAGPAWPPEALDRLQQRILTGIERDGRAFITPARVEGRTTLRVCIVNHRSRREDLELLLELILELGGRESAAGPV